MTPTERAALRRAVANYMGSEGCSCCQNIEAHREAYNALAALLKVPAYADGSGFNFYLYSDAHNQARRNQGRRY